MNPFCLIISLLVVDDVVAVGGVVRDQDDHHVAVGLGGTFTGTFSTRAGGLRGIPSFHHLSIDGGLDRDIVDSATDLHGLVARWWGHRDLWLLLHVPRSLTRLYHSGGGSDGQDEGCDEQFAHGSLSPKKRMDCLLVSDDDRIISCICQQYYFDIKSSKNLIFWAFSFHIFLFTWF